MSMAKFMAARFRTGYNPGLNRFLVSASNIACMILKKKCAVPLAKGQVWKVNDGCVQIVEIGKRLIHYKMFRERQNRAVPVRITSIHTVQDYLKSNRAVLVKAREHCAV